MSIPFRRAVQIGLFSGFTLTLAGCTREAQEGGTTIFTYALWVPGSILAAGVVAILVGVLIRKSVNRLGWGLIIVGPLAVFGFAPSLFRDSVAVNKDGFVQRTGFWFSQTVHEVAFDNVAHIELIAEEKVGRRGRRSTNYYLDCRLKNGSTERVPINDLMKQGANDKILGVARERNIPLVDKR
jgi:hypothetical protein